MSDSDTVLMDIDNGVMEITLNRPKANAFNREMIEATQAAFKKAARDPQVRCVLLNATGDVFSAGQDVKEVRQVEDTSFRYHLQRTYNPLVIQIRRLEKPVVVAINGAVAGAALGIALACDLRIAAQEARYADSTIAYQGFGYSLNLEQLRAIVDFATGGLVPGLTLLLDLDVEEGLRRRAGDGGWNRLDAYDLDFYKRVRQGYHQLAQLDPGRWVIIDAGKSFDQVQATIRQHVLERLGQPAR